MPGSLVGVVSAFDERLAMGFTGSSTRLENYRPRVAIVSRLRAVVQAPILDQELAQGVRPSASAAHWLRADHLRRLRVRRRIAAALNRAVDDAERPVTRGTLQVPLSREAVHYCRGEIRALANSVVTLEKPRTQGIAIASQLAFDGSGPLFFRPDGPGGIERLANTLHTARSALRVSADFDEPGR